MTTEHTVLTDTEIKDIIVGCYTAHLSNGIDWARAVERAVLAKQRSGDGFAYTDSTHTVVMASDGRYFVLGGVSEAEARRREREAFACGVGDCPQWESVRDRLYPTMDAPAPKTVTPLAVGDVVRMNSGGPTMTIVRVIGDSMFCTWFNDSMVQYDTFPAAALRREERP